MEDEKNGKNISANEPSADQSGADNAGEEGMKMEELLGPEVKLEEGKVINVKVVAVTPDGLVVDLGVKSDGLVPKIEFENNPGALAEITPGTTIPVIITSFQSEDGHLPVSWKKAREKDAWVKINAASKTNQPIEGIIRKQNKGGFLVDIGIEAFLPSSQVDTHFSKNADKYIGKKFQFLITEMNPEKRNIVLSRRKLLETENKLKREKALAGIKEGDIKEGTVTGITGFGAFVDIGGIEGLLHIGDISWQHIKKVETLLKTGQKVQVQILKIDPLAGKISLGMKQLIERPWNKAVEKYPVGTVVKGKITSITTFGAFVELEPGIEGLLHSSEVSWDEKKDDLKKKLSVGQVIEPKVIALDPEKEKLSLSLKRMQANPWEEASKKYPAGTKVKGVVSHLTPFGAFVKLPEGIEGLIHVADMSWTKKVNHPKDFVKVGQEVESVVVEINPQNEKISLSLKQVTQDPYKKYKAGTVVTGPVKRILDFGAFVELEAGIEALVRVSEISPQKIESASAVLKVGQIVEAKVIKSDPSERKIDISIKKLDHDREKELVKKYSGKQERQTLGDLLEEEE
jgi:small subunit ribosomal protein S1